jgi:hypothetical protein
VPLPLPIYLFMDYLSIVESISDTIFKPPAHFVFSGLLFDYPGRASVAETG